ncbi:hypothetical protein COR50_15020 [Chitinophaga caeni]|uniref:Uncharacterized protein n=1 Tax=Chitinophaga caeni TaxID=2029983 RepID=A0A291QWL9_9BACT|nr:hypothetical protein [Chitinophaga caeni]ATL48366.1 hypothetical protein COR50_15020 [Chitinophaga caeni]
MLNSIQFEPIDIYQARSLVKQLLPGLSDQQIEERVKMVDEAQMMKISGGKRAWGYFVDNMIYLQSAPDGTSRTQVVKHEVAHYIFNRYLSDNERERFIKELQKENPKMYYMTHDEKLEFVDEYIADKYQTIEKDKSIGSFIRSILRKIARFLGFSTPFIRNINQFLEAIDEGAFTRVSSDELNVSRPLLSVKNHFNGNTKLYINAKDIFADFVNQYMNPGENIQLEDGSIDFDNIPSSREEAVTRTLWNFQDELETLEKKNQVTELSAEEQYDYEMYKCVLYRDKRGHYPVFEELTKDFYPNMRFIKRGEYYHATEGNKEYDFTYDSYEDYHENLQDDQVTADTYDDTVPGNEGWLDNQDTINPLKKASQSVKEFMSTVTVKVHDHYELVNPSYVFLKLLENLNNIRLNDASLVNEVGEEMDQIRRNFISNGMGEVADESSVDYNIYKSLTDLLNKTEVYSDHKGRRLPEGISFRWEGDNQRGHYVFVRGTDVISPILSSGKKMTTENFFEKIHLETKLAYDLIKLLYTKEEATNTINSLYMVANSMRKKAPMFGSYTLEWKEGKQVITRKYGEFEDETAIAPVRNAVSNILAGKYSILDNEYSHEIASRNNKDVNKIKLAKDIMQDLGMITAQSSVFMIGNTAAHVLDIFDAIIKMSKKIGTVKGKEEDTEAPVIYTPQDMLSDSKGYIKTLANTIAQGNKQMGRSTSYLGGDRKPRWFYMNSTQGYDTLYTMVNGGIPRGFLSNRGTIFNYNIFNSGGDNKISTIHSIRDHDSIGEKDSTRNPILYSQELSRDFFDRNFQYSFVDFMATNTRRGFTYLQQFYTISNKPNMLAAQVDVLTPEKVREAIGLVIRQEMSRTAKGIANYDKNVKNRVTYLVGLDKALEPTATDKEVEEAIGKVYDALRLRALDAFEGYMDLNPVLDDSFGKVKRSLEEYNRLDENVLKIYDSKGIKIKDIVGAHNYDKLTQQGDRDIFKKVVFPTFHLFYINYFINSIFLNQLVAGDEAQYKDQYDEIKRMSMAFAIGYGGRVNSMSGMRRTFKVAVMKDLTDFIDNSTIIGRRFKRLFGSKYDLTDAQGFATPERVDNIRKGFSREANIGSTLKPVYFGIDPEGIARGIKYSTVEITNELAVAFPELAKLRFQMTFGNTEYATDPEIQDLYDNYINNRLDTKESERYKKLVNGIIDAGNHVDEVVFDSAFKVGRPAKSTDWKADGKIYGDSIVTLSSDNYRHQLNPRHDADAKTRNPSQLTYQVNTNGKNFARQSKMLNLNALAHKHGLTSVMRKVYPDGQINSAARHQVRKMVSEPLSKVPGNERYAEFMNDLDISLNLPNITNKLQQSFLASVSKRTVEIRHKGSKLVLQSSFGTTGSTVIRDMQYHEPRLVFIDENGKSSTEEGFDEDKIHTYYMEVYLPDIYKSSDLNIEDIAWINDPVYSSILGYRIPSTELHSAVPLKVVGFYPNKYGDNIVIAPKELVLLHGSDFDIDSLYTVNKFVAKDDIVYKGEKLAYKGVAVNYKFNGRATVKIREGQPEYIASRLEEIADEIEKLKENKVDDDNLSKLKDLYPKVENLLSESISNEILDTFLDTITAPENIDDMMTPISMAMFNDINDESSVFSLFADLNARKQTGKPLPARPQRHMYPSDEAFQDAVSQWNDDALSYIRTKRNLNTLEDELEMHQDNFRAAIATGISANAFKIVSYLYMGANRMDINTDLKEEEQKSPELKENFHIELDGKTYTGFSRYIYRNGELQDGKEGRKRITSFQVLDSIINAAIDHVKEQILNVINVSSATINSFLTMIAMGVDPNIASLFMTQPSLRELSNRPRSSLNLNNIMSEIKVAAMKNFGGQSYKVKYNQIVNNDELKPGVKRTQINSLASKYFNESVSSDSYQDLELTKETLSTNFIVDYDPDKMDENQLLFQLKVLSEYKKLDFIAGYLSKGSRALKSLQQIPSNFADIQNILLLYDKFFDIDTAIRAVNGSGEVVKVAGKIPFENVNLFNVPNIRSSIEVLASVGNCLGKFFLREGNKMVKFSDDVNTSMLSAGIDNTQFADDHENEDYIKEFDKGFLDWNAARSLLKIRENFIEYLMTGIAFTLPGGRRLNISTLNEPILDYTYSIKEYDVDAKSYTQVTRTATVTGTAAWTRRFLFEGFETEKDGKKVKLKPLSKLISQYGYRSLDSNKFISNLQIKYKYEGNVPYISFGIGPALDVVEKVEFENAFYKIKNLCIYEDGNGNDIDPEPLGVNEFNELQYNLLKYDILNNGLGFGTYSYSQVVAIPIYREVSKQLDKMMFELLDEKKAKYDLNNLKEHFMLQLALMNIDKVKSLNKYINTNSPIAGYDKNFNTYYDLIIENYSDKELSYSSLPFFGRWGKILYVKVIDEINDASPHLYYQKIGTFNYSSVYTFSASLLEQPYKISEHFRPSTLSLSVLDLEKLKNGDFAAYVNLELEKKATLIKIGNEIFINTISDYSRLFAKRFTVLSITKTKSNHNEIYILILKES